MDALTLMLLAEHRPRTAVHYTTPISMVKVAPIVECAACAWRYTDETGLNPKLRQVALDCYSVAGSILPSDHCEVCDGPVELNLDITR